MKDAAAAEREESSLEEPGGETGRFPAGNSMGRAMKKPFRSFLAKTHWKTQGLWGEVLATRWPKAPQGTTPQGTTVMRCSVRVCEKLAEQRLERA